MTTSAPGGGGEGGYEYRNTAHDSARILQYRTW